MENVWGAESPMSAARVARLVAAALLAAGLSACGGGGGGGGSDAGTPAAPTGPVLTARADLTVGEYMVYDKLQTNHNTGVTPVMVKLTWMFDRVGATVRKKETAYGTSSRLWTYDATSALASVSSGGLESCTYAPGLQFSPPYPRWVGQTWNITSTMNCSSTTSQQQGRVVAREPLTLPIGTFDSLRVERTGVDIGGTYRSDVIETCWYDTARGFVLRCETDYTYRHGAAGSTTGWTDVWVLSGMGGPGRAPTGFVLARFSGDWEMAYAGSPAVVCNRLQVSPDGSVSGACSTAPSGGFGTVNTHGALSITLQNGMTLTGTLSTPDSGSGTWTLGASSGTWTATRP